MADRRLDTGHEDMTSVPLSSLKAEVFVDPHHPSKLLEGLNRLRLSSVLCDVILCCEGQEVSCHRHVLASFSPYFEAMFTSGMRESTQDRVTISGVEPQMIGLLVNYAYTSKVSISADNVQALLAASDLLEVTSVREACCEYMKRHLDTTNCVEFYCCADDHSCERLKKHSLDYILEYFDVVYEEEEFLSLSVERLTEVLSSDHLNVPEEDMVFEAAMLWLDKSPTRKQSFGQVLEHIRLPLISPSYLHTVVESLDVVKEQQGCQRFISEAKGEQPYSNTARPRRTTVIVTLGEEITVRDAHSVQSLDPLTNRWKTLGRPPSELTFYGVVTSGSTMYLSGGCYLHDERIGIKDLWRYDVLQNSWLKMAPMNEPRFYFSLVMLDGYMFAVGGWYSEESRDSMERYDPRTDTWQLMKSVGVAAHHHVNSSDVVALDGHLYFIGGTPHPHDGEPGGQVVKFNPKTSVWTEVAPMQIPRDHPAACVLNAKIYITGGEHYYNGPVWCVMECYDPQSNQWTMCSSMQFKRVGHGVAVVDGKIYVLGGRDSTDAEKKSVPNIECYCDETDTWTTVGQSLANGRYQPKCVSLKLRRDHGQPTE